MTSFFVHILVKEDKIIGMKSYEALDKGQMPNYIKLYIKVLWFNVSVRYAYFTISTMFCINM